MSSQRERLENSAVKYQEAGLTTQRYMWDAFRFAKVQGNTTSWICDELYKYLDDSHINTALKAAFSELGLLNKNGSEVSWTPKESLDSNSKMDCDHEDESEETMGNRFAG